MEKSPEIYELFLAKMKDLEVFRSEYQSSRTTTALEQDDPELQRLTEAIAYFTAHTEELGKREINNLHRHLVQEIHPYVFTPLPSKTILETKADKLKDTVTLEAGTAFLLTSENGESAVFKTMHPLHLLPVRLSSVTVERKSPSVINANLVFSAFFTQTKIPGRISLYLNVLNDFAHTLSLFDSMKDMQIKPFASFNGDTKKYPVATSFSLKEPVWMHPIEQIRNQLHFPYADFFMYLDIDEAPSSWDSFSISIQLKRDGNEPDLSKDYFHLFCTPVINCKEESCKTISVNGIHSRYPVEPAGSEKHLQFLSLSGVFNNPGKHFNPLFPSVIYGGEGSYELFLSDKGIPSIDIRMPGVFEKPSDVFVSALWYQPVFSAVFFQRIRVTPFSVDIPGTSWSITRERTKHYSPFEEKNALSLYEMLSLHSGYEISCQILTRLFFLFSSGLAAEFNFITDSFQGFSEGDDCFYLHLTVDEGRYPVVNFFIEYFEKLVNVWFQDKGFRLVLYPDYCPEGV